MYLSERQIDTTETVTRALGWFSLGLGLVEVVAPQSVGRFLGIEEHTDLIRFYGVREIVSGVGILSQEIPEDTTPWLWARVVGDGMDLTTLKTALNPNNPQRGNAMGAIAAVAGITLIDLLCAQRLSPGHSDS